jgi:hypothetical protein
VALDDPVLVIEPLELKQSQAQLLEGGEAADPQKCSP